MKKALCFIPAITVLLFMALTGCELDFTGEIENEVTESAPETVSYEPEPEPLPFPVSVNGVVFEKAPDSVVSLSPALTEILCEMGYKSRLTGISAYCDYPPSIAELPVFGTGVEPDVNAIISAKPELVVSNNEIPSRDIFLMENAGIKFMCIPAPSSLGEMRRIYSAFGLIFEGLFTGTEKGEYSFAVLSQVCDNTGIIRIGKFVFITENLDIAGDDTLEGDILACFGDNLASGSEKYSFDKSLLLENEPDVIILNNKYSIRDLREDDVFSKLKAVKANKVIFIDNSYFERPSSRLTILIDRLLADYETLLEDIIIY